MEYRCASREARSRIGCPVISAAKVPMAVLHVVPRMGARLDGVADYAQALGRALLSGGADRVGYLSGDPSDEGPGADSGLDRSRLHGRSAGSLAAALGEFCKDRKLPESRAVLLHYVNYGYETRGCPRWLIRGLMDWKRAFPQTRLVTMFHELYAAGPPWRSSFWLSPVQRRLARQAYSLSDAVVTNREASRHWLARGRAGGARVMPVFSSLGEPDSRVPWDRRAAQLVVAGSSGAPDRAYGRRRESLLAACEALGIEEVIDIGARTQPVPSRIGRFPVTSLGHLAPSDACAVLAGARAGFIDYPSDFLAKSTVFAAYAAYGLVPVVSWRRGREEAGLGEGVNYWVPRRAPGMAPDFERIAIRACEWYSDHALAVQAGEFALMLWGRGD